MVDNANFKLLNILLLMLNGLFLACRPAGTPADATATLAVTDSLYIPLPDDIQLAGYQPVWTYGYGKLVFRSAVRNEQVALYVYDLQRGTWQYLPLSFTGPEQVYGAGTVAYLNDSLFVYFPENKPVVIVLDSQGKKRSEYRISNGSILHHAPDKHPLVARVGTKLGFDISESYPLDQPKTFNTARLFGWLDTASGQLTSIIHYPDEFKNKTWSYSGAAHKSLMLEDTLYLNFVKSAYVYRYTLQGDLIDKTVVNLPEIGEMPARKGDEMQDMLAFEATGYYPALIYDRWRQVFYRLVVYYDTKEPLNSLADIARMATKRTLAVIVFDRHMQVLGISRFGGNRLAKYYYFVNDQGLFLYALTNDKEEQLKFYRLNLERQ